MSSVRVTPSPTGERLFVKTPYSPAFRAALREMEAVWDGSRWSVHIRDEARLRDLLRGHFGTDGSLEEATDLVTVRTPLHYHETEERAVFGGRVIAQRRSRDATVRLHSGVTLVSGQLPASGGSICYPRIAAPAEATIEIRDIPRACLGTEDPSTYEVIAQRTVSTPTPEDLRAARDGLTQQIADINTELARLDPDGTAEEERTRAMAPPTKEQRDAALRERERWERATGAALKTLAEKLATAEQEKASAVQQITDHYEAQRRSEAATPLTCRCGEHTCPPSGQSISEYAARVGKTAQTVRNWCNDGRLNAVRHQGRWIILPDHGLSSRAQEERR